MSEYTYEYGDNNTTYETYEWDNVWIDHANDLETKRVLYIGDSISGATRSVIRFRGDESVRVDGFATSKALDNPYFKDAVAVFAKQLPKTDIVLFNNGLHGWHLSDDEYRFWYEEMVKFLMVTFKNSKLYVILTTHTLNENRKDSVPARNRAAEEVAKKYNLPVIDFYSLVYENEGLVSADKVHLAQGGNDILASKILEVVKDKGADAPKYNADAKWEETAQYLKEMCGKVLDAITHEVEAEFDGEKKHEKVVLPSYNKYPSVWIRDFAMNMDCEMMDADLVKEHILRFANYAQNGGELLELKNNLKVPAWAMADHLNYNGRPVYFPGTYSDSDDQGTGKFGFYPSLCDNYYFVHMVCSYIKQTGDYGILDQLCSGISLSERVEKAWEGYNIDEKTDLCFSSMPYYTVDWGFNDTVMKSGLLLFSSLLRFMTAKELSELCLKRGNDKKAEFYSAHAEKIKYSIIRTFWDGSGWLYSATGLCHQYDVWGTLFAIYIGILPTELEELAIKAIAKAYRDGIISESGYVRMIRTTDDAYEGQAWEALKPGSTEPNHYQNGAYWATPSGWLFYALAKEDMELAKQCIDEFVEHTKAFEDKGAPFEFISPQSTCWEGEFYGTSATLPYAGLKRIISEIL